MKPFRFLLIPILVTVVLAQSDDFNVQRDSLRAAYAQGDGESRLAATEAVATFRNLDSTVLLVSFISRQYALVEELLEQREAIRTGRDKSLKGARPEPYLASLKERLDTEYKVLFAVEDGFAKLTDEDSIRYLAKSVLGKHKHWKAREIAAGTLAEVGDRRLIPFLVKGLKDKDVRVRTAVVMSLGAMRAEEAFEAVLKMLGDKDWLVRSATIDALAKIRDMNAIPPLIERLKKEEGRIAEDVAEALTDLTGQTFGTMYDIWKKWWADHGEKILAGSKPKVPEPEEEKRPDDEYYHGIPVKSHRTIFILDISQSMTYSTTEFTEKPKPGERNRLDLAKVELGRAIDHYPPSGTFGLIAFHTVVKGWRPRLVKASAGMKKDAKVWVEDLKPTGTTNIYGALELAFRMAGMGIQDKYYPPTADTIFLLSDGAPTNEDLTDDDPDRVLRAVRHWNRLKRMKIHTIGLKGHSQTFMSTLAKENGGTYTSREK